ncbi:hypothetical protein KAS79_01145 [Candidatus Parcubacteria bacterium]|nr:hypothetical protein [Candidatus Parcubacteria bacterium]
MAQALLDNKLQMSRLQEEVKILRSFVIGIAGKDKEGEYKPEFVKKILKASQEKPEHRFKDKKSFLSMI